MDENEKRHRRRLIYLDRIGVLVALSILFLGSIFIVNKVVFAVAISTWLLSVIYNMKVMMSRTGLSDLDDELSDKINESLKNKKYGMSFLYGITFPMVLVGLIVVILDIGCIWYFGIK